MCLGRQIIGQLVGDDVHHLGREHHDLRRKVAHDVLPFGVDVIKRMLNLRERQLAGKFSPKPDAPAHGDHVAPLPVAAKNGIVVELFNRKHY